MVIVKEYLDTVGAKHIVDTVKTLISNINPEIDLSGYATTEVLTTAISNIDLSGYVTRQQMTDAINSIEGGEGVAGADGKDGVNGIGVQSVQLTNYELIITLTNGSVHNLGNIRGEKGDTGATGANGADGQNGSDATVDLTQYYTKTEIDALIANIGSGSGGESGSGTDTPSTRGGTSFIAGNSSLKVGSQRTYTGTFTNSDGSDATSSVTGTWSITDCSFTSDITQSVNGNSITLQCDNEDDFDETLTLNFTDANGNYTASTLELTVTGAF